MTLPRLLLACLLLGASALTAAADTPVRRPIAEVNINEFVRDIQRSSPDENRFDIVWWMPSEFWARSMAGQAPEADIREVRDLFDKYVVVAVVDGEIGALGMKAYTSEADLRSTLRLIDAKGQRVAPIAADKVDQRLTMLMRVMQPMLTSLIGPAGENMHFFAFPARPSNGARYAEPYGKGLLTIAVGERRYEFRTPLPSLLMPKRDPATGETFPGHYEFNPFTGARLETASSSN